MALKRPASMTSASETVDPVLLHFQVSSKADCYEANTKFIQMNFDTLQNVTHDDNAKSVPEAERIGIQETRNSLPAVNHVGHDSFADAGEWTGYKTEENADEEDSVAMENQPFNLRLINLNNFPVSLAAYRVNYRSHSMASVRAKMGCIQNTAKSLDSVRQILQKSINKEIDKVIQRYIQEFFQPALENIRINNGEEMVAEEHMNTVCRQILEESKKMYTADSRSVTPDLSDNFSDSGSVSENRGTRSNKPFCYLKRRMSSSSENSSHAQYIKKKVQSHLHGNSGRSTPSKIGRNDPVIREGPKWDDDRLKMDTLFVMGAKANKALGLGATRGRLYIKHPEIFKYSGDQDDKQWLHERHYMPATGGKTYLLLVADIKELARTEEYRNNPGVEAEALVGFGVPEWMLEKMKRQMCSMRTNILKTIALHAVAVPSSLSLVEDSSNTDNLASSPEEEDIEETAALSPIPVTDSFDQESNPSHDQEDTEELTALNSFENDAPIISSFYNE